MTHNIHWQPYTGKHIVIQHSVIVRIMHIIFCANAAKRVSRFTSGLNFRLFTMCAFLWLRNAIYRNWAVAGVRCGVLLCLHVFASVALLPSRTKHSARAYPSITCSCMGIMPLGSHNHSTSIHQRKNTLTNTFETCVAIRAELHTHTTHTWWWWGGEFVEKSMHLVG